MEPQRSWILRVLAGLFIQSVAFAAPETLTLERAIARALDNNPRMKGEKLSLQESEMDYEGAWNRMFYPNINLSFSAGTTYSVGDLEKRADLQSQKLHGYPSPSAQLTLGSYTLFNFWKDWNSFELSRLNWERRKQKYQETLRAFRFSVSQAYFQSKIVQDNLESSKRFYSIAESIHSLMETRHGVKKATDEEVSSAKQDVLKSRIELNKSITSSQEKGWSMNQILGDPLGSEYLLVDDPSFEPITQTVEDVLSLYRENSPRMKDYKLGIRSSEIALDQAEKGRLPLPTVSFSGLVLSYSNGFQDQSRQWNTERNKQLNVSASLSLTLPILGSDGFFGKWSIQRAYNSLERSKLDMRQGLLEDELSIRALLRTIVQNEENIRDYKESLKNSTGILDDLVSRISEKGGLRLEFRDALRQLRDDQASLAEANLNHLSSKYQLFELIGVDQLESKK